MKREHTSFVKGAPVFCGKKKQAVLLRERKGTACFCISGMYFVEKYFYNAATVQADGGTVAVVVTDEESVFYTDHGRVTVAVCFILFKQIAVRGEIKQMTV